MGWEDLSNDVEVESLLEIRKQKLPDHHTDDDQQQEFHAAEHPRRADLLDVKLGPDDLKERGYSLDLQVCLVPEGPAHVLLGHHLPKVRVLGRGASSALRGEEAFVHGATPVLLDLVVDVLLRDDAGSAMDGRAGASIDRSTPNDFGGGLGSGRARKVFVALRKTQRRQHLSIPRVDAVEVTCWGNLPRRFRNDGVFWVLRKKVSADRVLRARSGERLGGRGGAGTSRGSSNEGVDVGRYVARLVGWPTWTRKIGRSILCIVLVFDHVVAIVVKVGDATTFTDGLLTHRRGIIVWHGS